MKKYFFLFGILVCLTGCNKNTSNNNSDKNLTEIANPASVFCVEKGGEVIIEKDKEGNETGICKFANGQEVDEWEYFRSSQTNK